MKRRLNGNKHLSTHKFTHLCIHTHSPIDTFACTETNKHVCFSAMWRVPIQQRQLKYQEFYSQKRLKVLSVFKGGRALF